MVVKYKGREVLTMNPSSQGEGMVEITIHDIGKETVKRTDLNLDNDKSEEEKAAAKAEAAAAEKAAKDASDKAAKAKTEQVKPAANPVSPVVKSPTPVSVKAN